MESDTVRRAVIGMALCTIVFAQSVSGSVHWGYFGIYGVSNWSTVWEICDSKTHARQSPIDIIKDDTLFDPHLDELHLTIHRPSGKDYIIMVNNGHTVNFNYDKTVARISGGRFHGTFRVAGIHFHWGNNDTEGSEHTFDSVQYPIEMHIVAYDEHRYKGLLDASGGVNSIAVLGVLFKLADYDNPVLDSLVANLRYVKTVGAPIKIPWFDIESLLPPDKSRYYRYLGSLTTPPCSESVIWSVFESTKTISSAQLKRFRQLQEDIDATGEIDFLQDNWRPVQPIYDRIVQRSFDPKYCAPSGSESVKNPFSISLLLFMFGAEFLLAAVFNMQ